jgi:hypothetical protein
MGSTTTQEWFLKEGEEKIGPYALSEVRRLRSERALGPSAMVKGPKDPDWRPLYGAYLGMADAPVTIHDVLASLNIPVRQLFPTLGRVFDGACYAFGACLGVAAFWIMIWLLFTVILRTSMPWTPDRTAPQLSPGPTSYSP